jgi:hypothetical protein
VRTKSQESQPYRNCAECGLVPSDELAGRRIARAVVLVACLWNAGCRHAPAPDTGSSSFELVLPRLPPARPVAETVEPASRANYREAQAIHPLVMPVYPRRALAAKVGAATVGVRVAVDADGVVTDIRPSLLAVSVAPPAFAAEFREAAEVAVRQWRFEPARLERIETVTKEGKTYQLWAGSENVEAEFDLAFTFTPSGRVEQSPAKE